MKQLAIGNRQQATGNSKSNSSRHRTLLPAFSLTELMIAIGVLGIGLTMVASLFVTGLGQVRLSLGASEGMIISANGLEIARTLLSKDDVPGTSSSAPLVVIADANNITKISAAYQQYPYDSGGTSRGYIVLGRNVGGGTCQLAIVAYNKLSGGDVTAATITCGTGGVSSTTLTVSAGSPKVGSPVIFTSGSYAGQYATIESVGTGTAELDHKMTIPDGESAFVIVEAGQATDSPATGVLVSTVALE